MNKKWWGLLGGVIISVGALAYPFLETQEGYIVPGVRVVATEIGGLSRSEVRDLLEAQDKLLRKRVIYVTHDRYQYPLQTADVGLQIDIDKTVNEVVSYGRRGSLWQRWRERVWSRVYRPEVVPHMLYDAGKVRAWVENFQNSVSQPAQNASLDWAMDGTVRIIKERPRFHFSAAILQQEIEKALPMVTVQNISLRPETVTLPTVTAEMFSGIDSILGQYTTYFAEGGNRAANIRRAAAAINQSVVQAGDWFSFNGTTGPRIADQGYLEAPVFINGKLEPDYGGGVCQVSSTLFNSALVSGLDIIERTAHFAPVGYIDIGRDATVADHYLDLVLANTYSYPICIVARVGEGTLQIAVLGNHADVPTGVDLRQTEYRVIPHETVERVAANSSMLPNREEGHDGYQVAWVRNVTWNDGRSKTDSFGSYYEPVSTIVMVSVADKGKKEIIDHQTEVKEIGRLVNKEVQEAN